MGLLDTIGGVIGKFAPKSSNKISGGGIGSGHGMVPFDDNVRTIVSSMGCSVRGMVGRSISSRHGASGRVIVFVLRWLGWATPRAHFLWDQRLCLRSHYTQSKRRFRLPDVKNTMFSSFGISPHLQRLTWAATDPSHFCSSL